MACRLVDRQAGRRSCFGERRCTKGLAVKLGLHLRRWGRTRSCVPAECLRRCWRGTDCLLKMRQCCCPSDWSAGGRRDSRRAEKRWSSDVGSHCDGDPAGSRSSRFYGRAWWLGELGAMGWAGGFVKAEATGHLCRQHVRGIGTRLLHFPPRKQKARRRRARLRLLFPRRHSTQPSPAACQPGASARPQLTPAILCANPPRAKSFPALPNPLPVAVPSASVLRPIAHASTPFDTRR